jgi:deoxycytidylate deaminase
MIFISNRDQKFVNFAAKLAEDVEPWAGVRIAAVLACRGEILSFGYNDNKSHPFQAKFGKNEHAIYWHAETRCIANALKRNYRSLLPKSTMYIVRITSRKLPVLSRPCEGCDKAIRAHKIKRVLYSTGDLTEISSPIMEEFIIT